MTTTGVLADVEAERARQNTKWGEQNHPDGTDPNAMPLLKAHREAVQAMGVDVSLELVPADLLAKYSTAATDKAAAGGTVTWADILLEEVTEALAEADVVKLREELVQTAAVATQWAEAIDRRLAGA